MTLHVQTFGGGVVLQGAADTRGVDELLAADSVDLGARGAVQCAGGVRDYVALVDGGDDPVGALFALLTTSGINYVDTLAVTQGVSADGGGYAYLLTAFPREQADASGDPIPNNAGAFRRPSPGIAEGTVAPPLTPGIQVTSAVVQGPQTFAFNAVAYPRQWNVFLVNLGAREGTAPRKAPGLYVVVVDPPTPSDFTAYPVQKFDALGTGPYGEFAVAGWPGSLGTHSQQLYFRGIVGYNGYAFGWGFDADDVANGDGPCRVMFSNLGQPTKWGNDNQVTPPTGDRAFTDSDAITLGTAGEIIRAGIVVFGKLYFATNRGLHFIQGFGRDSFVTNGAIPVMRAYNCVGPNALIEGPDRSLYGVGDQGLWKFDGVSVPQPIFERLVQFDGTSPGFWDCIWTNALRPDGIPGRTNSDLVWTAIDWATQQVLVGIPWCDATTGAGPGLDTVIVKYHPRTGGFTRQVFPGVQYSAAGYFRRENQQNETRFLGTATPGVDTVRRFDTPLADPLPTTTFGPYAPFGPDGQGVIRRAYLTLAWSSVAALPLVFALTVAVDQATVTTCTLTVGPDAPSAPQDGDLWLDTAQTNASTGNAVGSATVRASGGYLLWTWNAGYRVLVAGAGMQGQRATITIPLARRLGTRVTCQMQCLAAGGRFEIEGLGFNPGAGVADA